jgi:glycosyltransferase involved in cell wall biosynthesis
MRLAWLGPVPSDQSNAGYAETQLLAQLSAAGIETRCYFGGEEKTLPPSLAILDGLDFVFEPVHWDWDRWYSRTPLSSFITGQAARAMAQRRLISVVARDHLLRPYDFLLQYSQIELFAIRRLLDRLPPIILYPSVHAAGELRWHRQEAALARRCEPAFSHLAARTMLKVRAARQHSDIRLASLVIALSRRFGEHLRNDYGVPSERIRVVPNPVDLDRFSPPGDACPPKGQPLTLLFASRMSVRKGVEMIVALSHRLADLADSVRIEAIGGETLWSRYAPLLGDLNPELASYGGSVDSTELAELYRRADVLLQPSHYEPFALTVGEGLASGVPVVASDEVGAAEGVDGRCCSVFPAGDLDSFEHAVRSLVVRLRTPERGAIQALARSEAERLFAPSTVAARLLAHLEDLRSSRGILPVGAQAA